MKCSHSCLLCLCGNVEYPGSFQIKLISSSLKWVPNYILFLPKLKGEVGLFGTERHRLIIGINNLLHVGLMLTYYKSVHDIVPTRGNREHAGNFRSKSVGYPFLWVFRYIIFLAKLKGKGRPILESVRRGDKMR